MFCMRFTKMKKIFSNRIPSINSDLSMKNIITNIVDRNWYFRGFYEKINITLLYFIYITKA